MKKMRKLIGLILTLVGAGGLIFTGMQIADAPKASSPETLQKIWTADIEAIKSDFPNWTSIQTVEFIAGDKLAEKWILDLEVPFPRNSTGEYKLEVLLSLLDPPKPSHAVIQHHLIHKKSGQSVYEVSRTYQMVEETKP